MGCLQTIKFSGINRNLVYEVPKVLSKQFSARETYILQDMLLTTTAKFKNDTIFFENYNSIIACGQKS